jgi:hypothetical protein
MHEVLADRGWRDESDGKFEHQEHPINMRKITNHLPHKQGPGFDQNKHREHTAAEQDDDVLLHINHRELIPTVQMDFT